MMEEEKIDLSEIETIPKTQYILRREIRTLGEEYIEFLELFQFH